jgi:hypothetical protein
VNDPVLRILPQCLRKDKLEGKPYNSGYSSLLGVCRASRNAALGESILWEVAKPSTYARTKKKYLLSKGDIYYFWGSEYWILDMLKVDHTSRGKEAEDYIHFVAPALKVYIDQLENLGHIAMNIPPWIGLMCADSSLQWLRYMPSLRNISIVLDAGTVWSPLSKSGIPTEFFRVKTGTTRDDYQRKTIWWSLKCLESFHSKFPEQFIPRIHVVTNDPFENNDGGGYPYSSELDHRLFNTALPLFLPDNTEDP